MIALALAVARGDDEGADGFSDLPATPAADVSSEAASPSRGSQSIPVENRAPASSVDGAAPRTIRWVSTQTLVERGEALPCTGPDEPINFEIFSAGPEIAGLPMTDAVRRCDAASPVDESPANRFTYMYGNCEIPEGATGCAPPLQVQTWPACQRNMAGYSYDGKPIPFRRLPNHGEAEIVEFDFELERRIEVYTGSSTIVIFSDDRELAQQALDLLAPQEKGKPPVTSPAGLQGNPPQRLGPPSDGATEGTLKCQT